MPSSYLPSQRWPGCFDSHGEAPLGTHTAGWDFWGQLSGLRQFEGGLPGAKELRKNRAGAIGAAWNGEVEAQPPRSPAGPTSGQGVLRDSEPWLPALGGRSSLFAAVSTLGPVQHERKVRCFLYIAMWIGLQTAGRGYVAQDLGAQVPLVPGTPCLCSTSPLPPSGR